MERDAEVQGEGEGEGETIAGAKAKTKAKTKAKARPGICLPYISGVELGMWQRRNRGERHRVTTR